jgi:hypothetical protein
MSSVWKIKLIKESTLRSCPNSKVYRAPSTAGGIGVQNSFESICVVFKRTIPSSKHTYLIRDCNCSIYRFDKIVGVPKLELDFFTVFCDGLPAVLYSIVSRHKRPVFRVKRGDGDRIVAIVCLLILHSQKRESAGLFWDRPFVGQRLAKQNWLPILLE